MYKAETICRLCLQVSESDFEIIDEITKSILDALCLEVDLSISKQAGMCKNCATTLQKSFDLMSTCQNTKDSISPFSINETMDMKSDVLTGKKNINITNNADYRACQFCTQIVKKGFYACLNQLEGDLVGLKDVLPNCIFDLYVTAVEEPVLCEFCHDSIQNHITYLKKFLEVERKIKNYYKIREIDNMIDQIDLGDVLQFVLSQNGISGRNLSIVKHENEEFIVAAELHLKMEPEIIDITSDSSCAERPQDMPSVAEKQVTSAKNASQTVYKCDKCKYETTNKKYFPQHFLIHRDTDIYECKACPYKTKYRFYFDRHSAVHKEVQMYKCDIYSFETKNNWYLNTHMLLHKDASETTTYKCEVCSYETKNKINLKRHLVNQHRYKCDKCFYKTNHRRQLRRHSLAHKRPSEVTLYKCDACMFMTHHKKNFASHVVSHKGLSDVTMHQCKTCTFKTRNKTNLRHHMLVHKSKSEVVVYKCENCSYETKRKSNLEQHMVTHMKFSEVEMFRCHLCSYETKRKTNLKQHVLVHKKPSEVIMYKCESCSYESKRKSRLKQHTLTHKSISEDGAETEKERMATLV